MPTTTKTKSSPKTSTPKTAPQPPSTPATTPVVKSESAAPETPTVKVRAQMSDEAKAKMSAANKRRARKQWKAVHAAGFTSLAAYKASLANQQASADGGAEGSNA